MIKAIVLFEIVNCPFLRSLYISPQSDSHVADFGCWLHWLFTALGHILSNLWRGQFT